MTLIATFTAAFAGRIRNSRIERSEPDMPYVVHVGDESSYLMTAIKYTYDLSVALKAAREWMDGIEREGI